MSDALTLTGTWWQPFGRTGLFYRTDTCVVDMVSDSLAQHSSTTAMAVVDWIGVDGTFLAVGIGAKSTIV